MRRCLPSLPEDQQQRRQSQPGLFVCGVEFENPAVSQKSLTRLPPLFLEFPTQEEGRGCIRCLGEPTVEKTHRLRPPETVHETGDESFAGQVRLHSTLLDMVEKVRGRTVQIASRRAIEETFKDQRLVVSVSLPIPIE